MLCHTARSYASQPLDQQVLSLKQSFGFSTIRAVGGPNASISVRLAIEPVKKVRLLSI